MSDSSDEDVIHSSLIGTKQYWDQCYERELKNYTEFGDLGEIWFGVKNSHRIVDWIKDNCDKQVTKVLDIGCGNGFLLTELAKHQFRRLFGVDYSRHSIDFCRRMAAKELNSNDITIVFEVLDILSDTSCEDSLTLDNSVFDCLIDKGTYDAICLMPGVDMKAIRDKYRCFVAKMSTKDTIFILMSCNHTKDQLFRDLAIAEWFVLIDEIKSPTFSFGGRVGSQVTGLILKAL